MTKTKIMNKTKTNSQKNRTPNTTTILLIITMVGFGLLFWLGNAQAAPLAGVNADMDSFQYDNATAFTDDTTDANDVDINDFQICGDTIDDAAYFGMDYIFDQIEITYDTACSGGAAVWEYYNGETWGSIEGLTGFSDETTDFTVAAGTRTVTIASVDNLPSDWAAVAVNSVTKYWIRSRITNGASGDVIGGSQASAREFNLKLKAQRESDLAALTGLTIGDFTITGGTDNTKFSFREIGSGVYELALDTAGADVNFDYTIGETGYITSSAIATGALTTTLTDLSGSPETLLFGLKVTVSSELGTNPSSIFNTLDAAQFRAAAKTISSTNVYYWADTAGAGGSLDLQEDGYVATQTTNNGGVTAITTGTTGQVAITLTSGASACSVAITTSSSCLGMQYAVKITATQEGDGSALDAATVTAGTGAYACTEDGSTGIYYCPVLVADLGTNTSIAKTGYITDTSGTYTDRAAQTTAQEPVTVANIKFGLKVIMTDELGAALTPTVAKTFKTIAADYSSTNTSYWADAAPGVAGVLSLQHDGYVATETTNSGGLTAITTNAATQVVITLANTTACTTAISSSSNCKGMEFAVKVIVDDETTENDIVTGVTVQAAGTGCTEDGTSGSYYCIVPLATLGTDVIVQKDGYVQKTISEAYNDRTIETDAQRIVGAGGDVTTAVNLQFAHKVTVTKEAGSSLILTGATVTAGSGNTACDEDGTTGVYYCPVPVAQDGGTNDVSIVKTGYETDATGDTSNRTSQTSGQGTVDVTGVLYQLKVIVADELNNSITDATTVTFDGNGSTYSSSGTYYWAFALANKTVAIEKDGYVTAATTNTGLTNVTTTAANGQTSITFDTSAASAAAIGDGDSVNIKGLLFGQKVTITTEVLGLAITPTAVTAGSGVTSCTIASNIAYCPVPVGQDDGTDDVSITLDGYVTNVTGDTGNRADGTSVQEAVTVNDVMYSHKITITEEDGNALASATVTSNGVTFTENGATGVYYGVVTLALDGESVSIVKAGYVTNTTQTATIRATNATIQVPLTESSVLFQLKVIVTNELGTAFNIVDLDTITYNGGAATQDNGTNTAYWATAAASAALLINDAGYVDSSTTNTAFAASITTAATGQTTITLDNGDANSTTIAAGDNVTAKGLVFGQKVTITTEVLGLAITPTAVTAGSGVTSCTIASNIAYCPVPVGQDDGTDDVSITLDGYVTNVTGDTGNRADGTSVQEAVTVNDVMYSHKITITEEDGNALDTATVATTGPTSFTESGSTGVYYGAVTLGNDDGLITITKAGYVTNNDQTATVRAGHATIQVPLIEAGVLFQLKVTTADELATAINIADLDVITYNSQVADYSSTNNAYFALAAASAPLAIEEDGYVTVATTNSALTASITTDATAQTTITLDTSGARTAAISAGDAVNIKGMEYAAKVTVTREGDGAAVSSATVTAGDSYGVSCSESGSTGVYYCIIPFAHTGIVGQITKADYADKLIYYTDRTANADTQGVLTATLLVQLDTTAPTVSSTVPNHTGAQTDIAVATSPTVTFDSAVHPDSVNPNSVCITTSNSAANECADSISATVNLNADNTVATINPIANLDYATAYYIHVTTDVQDQAENPIATNFVGSNSFTTLTDPDSTPPTITTPVPAGGDTDVSVGTTVTVTMSEALDTTTVNTNTVKLYVDVGNNNTVDIGTDTEVNATVSLENNGAATKIYITPVANLSYSGNYIYRISTGIQDSAGNALAVNGDYDFTTATDTADTTDPTVDSQFPTDNTTSTAVTISPTTTFDEVMDSTTLNTNTIQLKVYDTDAIVNSVITHNSTTTIATIDPVDSLDYLTQYYIWVSGAKDVAGNTVETYTTKAGQEFTTIANPDSTSPTITNAVPADAATDVAIDAVMAITFSESLANVDNSTVKLYIDADNSNTVNAGDVEFSSIVSLTNNGASTTINITSLSLLSNSGDYIYRISTGVTDVAGNALAVNGDYDFTTIASSADVTDPTVSAQFPTDNTTSTAVTISPTVTFDEAMDSDTVNDNTVQLRVYIGDAIVNSGVTLNYPTSTIATIDPVDSLDYDTQYYIWVSGAKDVAGNTVEDHVTKLGQEFTTVADSTPATPTIAIVTPSVSANITDASYNITFTTDSATTTAAYISIDGGSWVAATSNANPGTYTLDVSALTNGSHTVRVKDTVDGATGYSNTIVFITTYQPDSTNPTVSSIYPTDNLTNVAVTLDPYVVFSEAMDRTTLNSTNIKLCLVSDADCSSPITAPVSISEGDTRAVLVHGTSLENETAYWIYVGTGVKDVVGNALATAYGSTTASNFTTVALGDGSLVVTSIDSVESYATVGAGWPDGDAATADGWSWTFYITVPTTETLFEMKFNNWTSGDNSILVADNMRFYSAQATTAVDAAHAIDITAHATYSADMTLNSDLDSTTAGRQIEVTVEMQVPTGSSGGSYSTSYGVKSDAPAS